MSNITTGILIFLTVMKVIGLGSSGKAKDDVKFFVSKKDKAIATQAMKIAVLPLDNTSGDGNAPKKLLSSIANFIAGTGAYEIVDPGEVEKALLDLLIRNTGGLDKETAGKLGSALKCQGFLVGTIVEFGDVHVGSDSIPTLSVNMRFLDARTGNIVWVASITLSGGSSSSLFGSTKTVSLTKLVQIASKKIAEDLYKKRKDISLALAQPAEETTVASLSSAQNPSSTPSTLQTPGTENTALANGAVPLNFAEKTLTQEDIQKIAENLDGFVRGEMVSTVVFYNQLQTEYTKEGKVLRVKVVNYEKADKAKLFLAQRFSGAKEVPVAEGVTGYLIKDENGESALGMTAGQLGVHLVTASKNEDDLVPAAKHLLESISQILK